MSVNGVNTALSGLSANQFRQNVAANNVANVNTEGFRPASAQTTDAAYVNDIGQGTRPSAAYSPQRMPAPEPAAPAQASAQATGGAPQMSNVEMITETTNRMNAQSAYNANIPAARAADEMSQTLMDLRG